MDLFQQGGFFIYAILFVGFLVTVVSVERGLTLYYRFRLDADAFFARIKKFVDARSYREALDLCRSHPQIPLARVLEAGLVKRRASTEELQLSMDSEAVYQMPRIAGRVHFLASFANISTLLGLVGTVLGLIKSFGALGGTVVAGLNKGQALAAGVSESMVTTAGGLIVAIPAIAAHLFLSSRANRILDEVEHFSLELRKVLMAQKVDIHEAKEIKESKEALNESTEAIEKAHLTKTEILKSDKIAEELLRLSKVKSRANIELEQNMVTQHAEIKKI